LKIKERKKEMKELKERKKGKTKRNVNSIINSNVKTNTHAHKQTNKPKQTNKQTNKNKQINRGEGNDTFAFESKSWKKVVEYTFELTQVFRQKDPEFIRMLAEIRVGKVTPETK